MAIGLAASAPDVLESAFGRRATIQFLLAGLVPLCLLAVPLYLQTYAAVERETHETLRDYARLTAGALFETLDRARTELRAVVRLPAAPDRSGPFRRIWRGAPEEAPAAWGLDPARRSALERGEVVLSRPYVVEGAVTVSLVARRPDGGLVAGELEPEVVWSATRAGNFRPADALYVLDEAGRVLAASVEATPLETLVAGGIPAGGRKVGRGRIGGRDGLWAAADVFLAGAFAGERWSVLIVRGEEAVTALPHAILSTLAVVLALSLAALVLLSIRGARRLVRPVAELSAAVGRIESGAWAGLVEAVAPGDERQDEVKALGAAFYRMARRLQAERATLEERVRARTRAFEEAQESLIRSERLRAIGEMGAGIAHELRNRLTVVAAAIFHLRRAAGERPDLREKLEAAEREIRRSVRLTESILDFARTPEPVRERMALSLVVDQALPLVAAETRRRGIRIERAGEDVPDDLHGDAGQIQQVVMNLLLNAVQASPDGGTIRVSISSATAAGEGRPDLVLSIRDEGAGMDAATAARAFEPFFTTKADGTGLGLATARSIVERHGGRIEIDSAPGKGTEVRVVLPRDLRDGVAAAPA